MTTKTIKAKFIGKGVKGEKENFLIFLGTEEDGEPNIPFYVRETGKYALQYKQPFSRLDCKNYYKVEVNKNVKDPNK